MFSVDGGAMTLDELALVGDPHDGVDGGAITLDLLVILVILELGPRSDEWHRRWFHHGQRKVW